MWIMLTTKLPVKPSPPKLAILWSTPWLDQEKINDQFKRFKDYHEGQWDDPREAKLKAWKMVCETEDYFFDEFDFGKEHVEARARAIMYKGEKIKVFPAEYSSMTDEKMSLYVQGDGSGDPSHYLVEDGNSIAEDFIIKGILDGEIRPIYEAALIDGCTHAQAMMTAMEMDITLPDAQYPAIGWYRCHPQYAQLYCHDFEMQE
jgi:hypothetical protein